MFGDVYFFKDLDDRAAAIDQKCLAVGPHIFFAVHALFYPDAVSLDDLFVGIGEQVKRQLKL